jgi:hypothetical protein
MDDERILEWLTSQDVIEVRLLFGFINNFFCPLDIQNKRKNCIKDIVQPKKRWVYCRGVPVDSS